MYIRPKFLALALCSLSMFACTSGGGSSDGDGGSSGGSNRSFTTDCGVVHQGELRNPVAEGDGVPGFVAEVVTHNTVIFDVASGGRLLVKLHGLSNNASLAQKTRAQATLQGLIGPATFFRPQEQGCEVTVTGGGVAAVGGLVSNTGLSLAEAVLSSGGASADSNDVCGGSLIGGCYRALEEEASSRLPQTGATVTRFLWKPAAERDNNLVVLISPHAAQIIAGGSVLSNSGASNGFSQTARGNKPGCAYGGNVSVQAKDSQGRLLVWPDGSTQFTIANGCQRVEF